MSAHISCPECGCEETGQGGYLTCQCPSRATPRTHAYAYKQDDGIILAETVGLTHKAAVVNTIYVATFGHVMPTNDMTDPQLAELFINATGGKGKVVAVTIIETNPDPIVSKGDTPHV